MHVYFQSARLWLEMFLNILISSILLIYTPYAPCRLLYNSRNLSLFLIPNGWDFYAQSLKMTPKTSEYWHLGSITLKYHIPDTSYGIPSLWHPYLTTLDLPWRAPCILPSFKNFWDKDHIYSSKYVYIFQGSSLIS